MDVCEDIAQAIHYLMNALDHSIRCITPGSEREAISYDEWRDQMPQIFPAQIESTSESLSGMLFQNPIIGGNSEQTRENVLNVLSLFELFPSDEGPTKPTTLSLNKAQTHGYCLLLDCIRMAALFEGTYRPDGGLYQDESEGNESGD